MNYPAASSGVSKTLLPVIPHVMRIPESKATRSGTFLLVPDARPLDSRFHGNNMSGYLTPRLTSASGRGIKKQNNTMKTIMILKNNHNPNRFYVIDALALRWMKMGCEVVTHYGTKNLPDADIVILHVDKTIVPDEYVECLSKYPIVLNRNTLDISKSLISKNLVRPEEDYSGPVIIKTNANFGGVREAREENISKKPKRRWWLLKTKPQWEKIDELNPHKYPIFKSKESIPAGVWKNKNLIVEKFLPEIENGLFFLRYWVFFGEQGWAGRFGAKKPIVKFRKRVTKDEPIPIPDELRSVRKNFGLDYGRFDFVEHQGKTVLYDVNKTLGVGGGGRQLEAYSAQLDILARGINGF